MRIITCDNIKLIVRRHLLYKHKHLSVCYTDCQSWARHCSYTVHIQESPTMRLHTLSVRKARQRCNYRVFNNEIPTSKHMYILIQTDYKFKSFFLTNQWLEYISMNQQISSQSWLNSGIQQEWKALQFHMVMRGIKNLKHWPR